MRVIGRTVTNAFSFCAARNNFLRLIICILQAAVHIKLARFAASYDTYIGVESGDDTILKRVNKGYDAKTAREQLEKLTAADFSIIANFLNGLGGKDYGLSHAQKTAEIYDGIKISMTEVSSLTLVPKTNLYHMKMKGKFEEATEVERLREMQEFLRRLTNETVFLSDHISMPFFVKAELPARRDEIIAGIDKIIDEVGEEVLRRHRELNPIM